jgi:hypothetical protein
MARKIFIGFKNIIGYGTSLRDGFREIGEEAYFYSFEEDKYQRGEPDSDIISDVIRLCKSAIYPPIGFKILKIPFIVLSEVCIFIFYLLLPLRFNVFVFLSEYKYQKFILWWIKQFNKKIFFVFFGSEIRPANIDGVIDGNFSKEDISNIIIKQKTLVNIVECYSDYIISHPPISLFQTRPFFQYMKIGVPTPKRHCTIKSHGNVTRIVHAPTSRKSKGSFEIQNVVETMIENGYKIIYVELYGLPHTRVIDEILKSDIVIDQLYSDIPSSGTSIDGCSCGVPVISGTYYDFSEYNLYPGVDYPECVLCNPDNVMYELDRMIADYNITRDIGKKAHHFVVDSWNPSAVASKYVDILDGRANTDWIYIPSLNKQAYGYGFKH